jgi:hypothetical protein
MHIEVIAGPVVWLMELSAYGVVVPARRGGGTGRRERDGNRSHQESAFMSIGTIILIILVIALLGGFSGIGGGPFYGTGYYGGGGLGLVIIILLILLLMGRL